MLKGDDPAGNESRARDMGVTLEYLTKIKNSDSFQDIEYAIDGFVQERHKQHKLEIDNAIKGYDESWQSIIDEFSEIVYKLTEHDWFYEEYICVISPIHRGISNWYGNTIARKCGDDYHKQRRITAHEIILSHFFHIIRKYYSNDQLSDWRTWAFSEISTVFILNNEDLLKFWDWFIPSGNYFSKTNYPQLAKVEDELRKIYGTKENVMDYVNKAKELLNSIDEKLMFV